MLVSSFCVRHLLLGSMATMVPTLKSGLLPSETSLNKTNFSFASGYQSEIASGLGLQHVPMSPSALGPHMVQPHSDPVYSTLCALPWAL